MRGSRRLLVVIVPALVVALVAVARAEARVPTGSRDAGGARGSSDTLGDARRGRAIVEATRDSLPRHAGNALRCTSCHLDGGTRATASAWYGVARTYPRYRARRGAVETLPQRVNECLTRSLAGVPLAEDSPEMRDIVAWLDSLGRAAPLPRPDTVRLAGRASHGARVYAASCARCHGATGREGGSAPPVWGARSYSIGAGLARQTLLATFVHHNMPYDGAARLTPQQAADVAAWVLSRPRLDHAGKEGDWPNGDAPPDVAYPTEGARRAGRPLPPPRPVLPRR